MTDEQKTMKVLELEGIKIRLVELANELLTVSDSYCYTCLHLNEAKNVLTRVQREIQGFKHINHNGLSGELK